MYNKGPYQFVQLCWLIWICTVPICSEDTFSLGATHIVIIRYVFNTIRVLDFEHITKTYLYNFDPLKPHFYIVKLGFTGVFIISLISAQKHRLSVLVRTASARPAQWLSGRASALWPGGCGFDPRPGHTKDFKNGTSCSFAWRSALRK